jgi:microcystin-dependent protein
MSLFNKKYLFDPLKDKSRDRRNFIMKSLTALFGITILSKAEDLFAMKSKTGFLYLKQNGEVINNYKPSAGDSPFLGEIGIFPFNFAPRYWEQCNGQLLSIAQNPTLFSLLGTYYGGDGNITFGLPDLRGRVPLCYGQGSGLSDYPIGEKIGAESVTLLSSQIPEHNHLVTVSNVVGSQLDPANNYISQFGEGVKTFSGTGDTTLSSTTLSNAGGNQAHTNIQPYLTLNYCIALQGLFPSQ